MRRAKGLAAAAGHAASDCDAVAPGPATIGIIPFPWGSRSAGRPPRCSALPGSRAPPPPGTCPAAGAISSWISGHDSEGLGSWSTLVSAALFSYARRRARSAPRSQRDPTRDRQQPTAQGIVPADRTCPGRQHQESRLKSVLNVVGIAKDIAADAQDHAPMPYDAGRGTPPQRFRRRHPGIGPEAGRPRGSRPPRPGSMNSAHSARRYAWFGPTLARISG